LSDSGQSSRSHDLRVKKLILAIRFYELNTPTYDSLQQLYSALLDYSTRYADVYGFNEDYPGRAVM
jgi:hypothetical protein